MSSQISLVRAAEPVGSRRFLWTKNPSGFDVYGGVVVRLDPEEGFHGSRGVMAHFGYHDTLAGLLEEIDDFNAEEAVHYGDRDTPPDTPCIDTAFHDGEMDI